LTINPDAVFPFLMQLSKNDAMILAIRHSISH
jgi:hypothetical protein